MLCYLTFSVLHFRRDLFITLFLATLFLIFDVFAFFTRVRFSLQALKLTRG